MCGPSKIHFFKEDLSMELFQVTLRRSYWCTETVKWRPIFHCQLLLSVMNKIKSPFMYY